jgi:hypothetical protein
MKPPLSTKSIGTKVSEEKFAAVVMRVPIRRRGGVFTFPVQGPEQGRAIRCYMRSFPCSDCTIVHREAPQKP